MAAGLFTPGNINTPTGKRIGRLGVSASVQFQRPPRPAAAGTMATPLAHALAYDERWGLCGGP